MVPTSGNLVKKDPSRSSLQVIEGTVVLRPFTQSQSSADPDRIESLHCTELVSLVYIPGKTHTQHLRLSDDASSNNPWAGPPTCPKAPPASQLPRSLQTLSYNRINLSTSDVLL